MALRTRFRGFGAAAWPYETTPEVVEQEGRWAGHCFDISTVQWHERERHGEQGRWKDISEEIAQEMKLLWTEEYGALFDDLS